MPARSILAHYVDEFTFRLNEGNVKHPHDDTTRQLHRRLADKRHIQRVDPMSEPRIPKVLDAVVDKVLAYKPKPKTKPAKKRKRRASKIARSAHSGNPESAKECSAWVSYPNVRSVRARVRCGE